MPVHNIICAHSFGAIPIVPQAMLVHRPDPSSCSLKVPSDRPVDIIIIHVVPIPCHQTTMPDVLLIRNSSICVAVTAYLSANALVAVSTVAVQPNVGVNLGSFKLSYGLGRVWVRPRSSFLSNAVPRA